jgi:hypothetical protein
LRDYYNDAVLDLEAEDLQNFMVRLDQLDRRRIRILEQDHCVHLIAGRLLHQLGFDQVLYLLIGVCNLDISEANGVNEVQDQGLLIGFIGENLL